MTDFDWKLLKKAHATPAVDNQEVEKMIPLADTEKCRGLLKCHFHYLYTEEERMAGLM